jgi:hypothetical protein
VGVLAACRRGAGQGFVHDPTNGTRAPPALGAATEAMIDLARCPRRIFADRQRRAHVLVGEHVTGADDHHTGARR